MKKKCIILEEVISVLFDLLSIYLCTCIRVCTGTLVFVLHYDNNRNFMIQFDTSKIQYTKIKREKSEERECRHSMT